MTPLVTVEWPMTLPSSANTREHWAVKAKRVKAQRAATTLAMRTGAGSTTPSALRVLRAHGLESRLVTTIVRVSPRQLDDDNAVAAAKAVRDAIAEFFGLDDGDTARCRWLYAQERGKYPRVRLEFSLETAPIMERAS